ncbi:Pre-rRNA-processing protein RIX1 [Spathaspora sp. JA1]|nr:Pre-rRNA-processing protein RIX1 [Spathaspora sp. JA1]
MSMPISIILEELKTTPTSVVPLLRSLHNKTLLQSLTKSEVTHLTSRVLNLARSNQPYSQWCGINLIRVVSSDYSILAGYGNIFLDQLLKIAEQRAATNKVLLINCVDVISYICGEIRGKPGLTREILTPKLGQIIGLFIEKLHVAPFEILKSLVVIIKFHPTTFRPYGNKLNSKLVRLVNDAGFVNYPSKLKEVVYEAMAVLPAIEKSEPEVKWSNDLFGLITEIKEVVEVFQEFVHFKDDQDLIDNLRKLEKANTESKLFEDLNIDLNSPNTIFQLSNRIDISLGLLKSYLVTESQFTVKVPLGSILTVCEVITGLNLRMLRFKGDIRDEDVKNIIKSAITNIHHSVVLFLSDIVEIYKGGLLLHFQAILGMLEVIIPMKGSKVGYEELISNEGLMVDVLLCVAKYVSLVKHLDDNTQLLPFVDVSMILVDPRTNQKAKDDQKTQDGGNNKKGNKKQKKKGNAAALSDILSHEHLFMESVPANTVSAVRKFINAIIKTIVLSPNQHFKVLRYLIIETINVRHANQQHLVPEELKQLLIDSVLFPGYDKVNILPIVSSVLKDDQLLSVFNNPRFPPLPKYVKQEELVQQHIDEEDEEDEDESMESEQINDIASLSKKRKLEELVETRQPEQVQPESQPEQDDSKLFKKSKQVEEVVSEVPVEVANDASIVVDEEVSKVVETVEPIAVSVTTGATSSTLGQGSVNNEDDDDDEDEIEIPELDIGESSDEE